MKITHNKVGQHVNLTDSQRSEKTDKTEKTDKVGKGAADSLAHGLSDLAEGDRSATVALSDRAQSIKKAKEIAKAAPEVRSEKVAELQKMIDGGKYNVPAKDVADKMVDEELQWL